MINRGVSEAFKAMNRNGFGAACTAVLVKFRLPRISCLSLVMLEQKRRLMHLQGLDLDLRIRPVEVSCDNNVRDALVVQWTERFG